MILAAALTTLVFAQDPLRVVPGAQPDTRTIYRASKPGEERVEGFLRRIDCPRGQPVTFTLTKADKTPMKFTAPSLTSVDYIAHTPTFRGPVSCGGRTPPDRVYLTWVPSTKRVVAVEFLPPK
jgi:hypothetical protein